MLYRISSRLLSTSIRYSQLVRTATTTQLPNGFGSSESSFLSSRSFAHDAHAKMVEPKIKSCEDGIEYGGCLDTIEGELKQAARKKGVVR